MVNFFHIFEINCFALLLLCDLVHDMETMCGLCWLLIASGNLFYNMSDAWETANGSFPAIIHISEMIARC